jgi:hypothetical protein
VIQPKTDSTTIGIGSSASGTLSLNDTELGYLVDGFSSITLGSTTGTGAIAINYAGSYAFTDPLTIRSKSTSGGGAITAADTLSTGTNSLTVTTYGAVSLAGITSGILAVTGNGITLNNDITTSGTQTYTGAVTLGASITAASTGVASTGNNISFSSSINGTTANTQSLTLNSGTGGTITVSGQTGTSTSLLTLTLTNSNGATFTGAVTTGTSVVLSNTSSGTTILFSGALTTPTLTTAAQGYNLQLLGTSGTITNNVTFTNTGSLSLGSSGGTQTYSGGMTATAPSGVTLYGTLTMGGVAEIGDSNTGVTLGAATSISSAAANANLTMGGAVTGAANALTMNAGTATIAFASTASGLGAVSLTANEVNFGGNFAGNSTLAILPSTTARGIYLGASDNSATSVLNLTTTELGYLVDGFTAITIGGSGISGDFTSQSNLSFKDPVTFTTTGAFNLGHNLSAASSTNAAFTVTGPMLWNAGNITTSSGVVTINGNLTLGGSGTRGITTSTGVVTIGDAVTDTVTGATVNLTINSGSAATTVNASLNNIGALGLGTSSQTGAMTVNNVITATSLNTGSTAYNLVLNGGTNATSVIGTSGSSSYSLTFNNTGNLTINNLSGNTFTVLGSLTINAPSALSLAGTILTAGAISASTNITITTNVTIDTTSDVNGTSGLGAGAAMTFSGNVGGESQGGSGLTISSGAGAVNFLGSVGGTGAAGSMVFDGTSRFTWGFNEGLTNITREIVFSTTQAGGLFSVTGGGHDRHLGIQTDGNIYSRVWSNEVIITTGVNVLDGLQHDLVFTLGASGTKIYVDGVLRASGTKTSSDFDWASSQQLGYSEDKGSFTGTVYSYKSWFGSASNVATIAGGTITSSGVTLANPNTNIGFTGGVVTDTGSSASSITVFNTVTAGSASSGNSLSAVTINNNQSGNVDFAGNLRTTAFTSGAGNYNLSMTGPTNVITNSVTFTNRGTLQLGSASSDATTFGGGFTATVPSTVSLAGTIISNGITSIGDSGTPVSLLAATTINTSGGSSSTTRALTLGGALTADNIGLTVNTGSGVFQTAALAIVLSCAIALVSR